MTVTINGNGTITPTSAIQPTGSILQVVQDTTTAAASTASSTYVDTGLSQAITPTSSSSKILLTCSVLYSALNNAYTGFRAVRDSTNIGVSSEGTGNHSNVSFTGIGDVNYMQYYLKTVSWTYLDSPSTTNATTYKIQFNNAYDGSSTVYINRPHVITDNSHVFYGTSTLTLMEVAG